MSDKEQTSETSEAALSATEAVALAGRHLRAGRRAKASALCERILQVDQRNSGALHLLGVIAAEQRNLAEAVELIRRAIAINGRVAAYHSNLGNALSGLGRPEDAVASYARALELQPDSAETHNNLGAALRQLGRLDEAEACFNRALALNPKFAEAHYNLGNALTGLQRYDDSVASYDQALALEPDYADAHNSRGGALLQLGRLDEAAASRRRAIAIRPEDASAHYNLAIVHLLQGRLKDGWDAYEWRWRLERFRPRGFPQPMWDGGALAGKTILVHAEQGFGDAIQFLRYLPLVKALAAEVLLEVRPPLLRLAAQLSDQVRLLARGAPLPEFDVHCPMLSLPRAFRTTLDTIPGAWTPVVARVAESLRQRAAA